MNIQTVTHKGISFFNIHNPQELEIKFLRKNFGFNPLNLDDYLNKTQVPKIEIYKDYTYIVLDFPSFEQNGMQKSNEKKTLAMQIPLPHFPPLAQKKRIRTDHVATFIGRDYLIVLHDEKTSQIDDIFALCQKALRHREDFMGEGPVFLFYRLVDTLVDSAFSVVNDLTVTIDYIDRELAQNRSPHLVEDISTTRRNIVVFQTMIKPILPIFADLEKGNYKELNGAMTPFWSNILDHLQKIWERLEDSKELIEGIATSNESFLTVKTNETIRILTIFSAIILPLNLLASIYGMNIIGLPYADAPIALFLIALAMLALAFGMMFVFRYKNWL